MKLLRGLKQDDGSLLVEIMVASSITLGILAILGTLVMSVFKTDTYTDQDNRTLATLRTTNDRIVKELRQAGKIYIESFECASGEGEQDNLNRMVRFWIDKNSDGSQEALEQITWRVEPTVDGKAQLTRKTEATAPIVHSTDLLWDGARKYFDFSPPVAACDPVSLPQPTAVTVSLIGDVEPDRVAVSREIHSEVKLRNVPD